MVLSASRQHLKAAGKSYVPHGTFALKAGILLFYAGFTSIVHAIVPAWYPFKARDITRALAEESQRQEAAARAKQTLPNER
ncbi:MAG: DUF6356 family protein [Vampirovibrionales bacterium]